MYRKDPAGWLKHYDFILLDMLCLQVAFFLAFIARFWGSLPYAVLLYRNMAIILGLADIIVIFALDTFHGVLKRGYYKEFIITLENAAVVGMLSVLYLFAVQDAQVYSRSVFLCTFIFYIGITYGIRIFWRRHLRKRMVSGGDRSLLVVTTWDKARTVVKNLKENNFSMFRIAGIVAVDQDMTGESVEGIPVVCDGTSAPMYVCRQWIDDVLIIPSDTGEFPKELHDQFIETGVTVHYKLAKLMEVPGEKQFVEKIGGYPVLTTAINYVSARQILVKRIMDILGGITGCILTGIIFLFIAPAIYISSPGPIFFSQERVGKNGKKFKIYKFRSMYMDAEERKKELMAQNEMNGFMFKMSDDPRITKVGKFIRKASIDELPQFLNVLRGDMSLVGTRPPTVDEYKHYESHHKRRLSMKPGITGMWQVSGRSSIEDFEDVVALDTQYIDNWSLKLDIQILFKTVAVVFMGRGAK